MSTRLGLIRQRWASSLLKFCSLFSSPLRVDDCRTQELLQLEQQVAQVGRLLYEHQFPEAFGASNALLVAAHALREEARAEISKARDALKCCETVAGEPPGAPAVRLGGVAAMAGLALVVWVVAAAGRGAGGAYGGGWGGWGGYGAGAYGLGPFGRRLGARYGRYYKRAVL